MAATIARVIKFPVNICISHSFCQPEEQGTAGRQCLTTDGRSWISKPMVIPV